MKIKTSAIPEWFFQTDLFKLETNSSNLNYNSPKKRIHDYSTFPTYTAPSNKIAGHPEYDYTFMKNQENNASRIDPGQQVGYNIFPKLNGLLPGDTDAFLNAYTGSQQIRFAVEGGLVFNDDLNLSPTPERIQWINGEISNGHGIGYTLEEHLAPRVKKMLDNVKQNPISTNSKYGIYSLQAFPIWSDIYETIAGSTSAADKLCNYLENPNTIPNNIMELCGFDYLMEDLYCIDSNKSQFYCAMGIYMKQLARKKYLQTNKEIYNKFYMLLWSHTEFFLSKMKYKKNDGSFIQMGEFDGVIKSPANINTNYNLALAGVTIADGFWHFIDRFCTFGSVNVSNENGNVTVRDLEKESIQNNDLSTYPFALTTYLRGQYYKILPAVVWLGVNQYSALAIWHAHLQRDIIEDTTYDWFTPDFIFNNNERTGKFKEIPYNLHFKEPTVQAKYSADKTECLLYVCNFDTDNITQQIVTIKLKNKDNNDVNVPVVLKGTKAELVRVTF
jgi:hypothetical protein